MKKAFKTIITALASALSICCGSLLVATEQAGPGMLHLII